MDTHPKVVFSAPRTTRCDAASRRSDFVSAMNASTYSFGAFRLVPARRELYDADRLLPVQPRVFDTLTYLPQHRDRAVGRDELIAAVWGRVAITDNLLSQIVARARQAVGDCADEQHTIRTLPRFGYRWVRDIELAEATPIPAPALPTEPIRRWPRHVGGLCALGLIALLRASTGAPPIPNSAPRLAVVVASTPTERLAHLRAALATHQLDAARTLLRDLPEADRLRPDVRYEAATLALEDGQADGALAAFRALLADLDPLPQKTLLVGKTHYAAGQAEAKLGNVESARHHFREAIRLLADEATPEAKATLGRAWTSLGSLHVAQHDLDKAEAAYAKALTALEGTVDLRAQAQLDNSLGVLQYQRYQDAAATAHLQRAIDVAAQAGDPPLAKTTSARDQIAYYKSQHGNAAPAAAMAERTITQLCSSPAKLPRPSRALPSDPYGYLVETSASFQEAIAFASVMETDGAPGKDVDQIRDFTLAKIREPAGLYVPGNHERSAGYAGAVGFLAGFRLSRFA